MKVGKPKSKRVPVRLRHNIEKAAAAKQRKQRKLAKKNPQWRSRLKKDPGIPNLFPYKDRILHEIEEKRRLKEEEALRRREEARARTAEKGDAEEVNGEEAMGDDPAEMDGGEDAVDGADEMEDIDDTSNPMAALLASAQARAAEYKGDAMDEDRMEEDEGDDEWHGLDEDGDAGPENGASSSRRDSSRKSFDKIFKEVVDASDVVFYVLDARDPEGTRSREVERMVMAAEGGSKRLILILNKIDLIPPAVLRSWLTHLRRYFPTLPLRASNPAPNARTFDHKQLTVKGTSEALFKALKAYAASKQLKRAISVGVIGYPNVGKSSVINALTSRMGSRTVACPVGAEAGVTTSLREVKLDSKLKLLDCPGIVFPSSAESNQSIGGDRKGQEKKDAHARLILLNAVPPKEVDDPIPAVTLLLRRLSASEELFAKLLQVYDLPPLVPRDGDATTDFLVQVARKRGRLGKGGVPNLNSAAKTVITDWRDGRIQGWVEAPGMERHGSLASGDAGRFAVPAVAGDQKDIVKEWAAEFKIEGLWGGGGDDEAMES